MLDRGLPALVVTALFPLCAVGFLVDWREAHATPPQRVETRAASASPQNKAALAGQPVGETAPPKIHPALLRRLDAAGETEPVKAWVLFKDKGVTSERDYQTRIRELASTYDPRATARRFKRRTLPGLFDEHDLPVAQRYLDAVAATGVELRRVSNWVNGVSVFGKREQFERIAAQPAVRILQPVRRGVKIQPTNIKERQPNRSLNESMDKSARESFYGASEEQLVQLNLPAVHDLGHTASGVVVGILDTGFQRSHVAFNDPAHPVNVIGEYDFVDDDWDTSREPDDPPYQHGHGTYILGTLGAYKPGELVGAAYDASFILCKTEDITDEYPAEEDNYVAGLEFIEANGGDMATSSLIYSDWYTQDDMDGMTGVTTLAVNIATANGVHCCTAAGNYGHDSDPTTSHLGAPADAFQVITCGAVDAMGYTASFSSDGPSADGRVKPEVLARGVNTQTVSTSSNTDYEGVGGTSLSTPLVAGVVACLVQAHPEWTTDEMRTQLFATADYYATHQTFDPEYVRGYGILDALAAVVTTTECQIASQPIDDPIPVPVDAGSGTKNRYLSFMGGDAGRMQAVQVEFVNLPDFPYANGRTAWVQEPYLVTEASGSEPPLPPPTMWAAELDCTPYHTVWTSYGTAVHVLDDGIVPGSTYNVRLIDSTCDCHDPNLYGPPLTVNTSAAGDVVGDCGPSPCTAPQGVVDFVDITAVVDKFMNTLGAIRKARADVTPGNLLVPKPDKKVDFVDISCVVSAFRADPCYLPGPPPVDPCPGLCP